MNGKSYPCMQSKSTSDNSDKREAIVNYKSFNKILHDKVYVKELFSQAQIEELMTIINTAPIMINEHKEQYINTEYTNRYIVVCDTGGHWEGADYSVAIVFDRLKKEVAAIARGHFDDYEFADIAVDLCKLYGKAKLMEEIKNNRHEFEQLEFNFNKKKGK